NLAYRARSDLNIIHSSVVEKSHLWHRNNAPSQPEFGLRVEPGRRTPTRLEAGPSSDAGEMTLNEPSVSSTTAATSSRLATPAARTAARTSSAVTRSWSRASDSSLPSSNN